MRPEEDGAEPHGSPEPGLEEALFELDRYQRGFENLERQVRVLDRERQKLAVVLNNARVGFLVVDDQLRMTWANPALSTGFGIHPAVHGQDRRCCDLLCGSPDICAECPARRALAGQPNPQLEISRTDGNAPQRWYASAALVRSHLGSTDEALVMVQDLTDLEMLRRSESSLSGQKHVLELMARGAALDQVLTAIALLVEERRPGVHCAISLLDEAGQRLRGGVAPNLPPGYQALVDGLEIGPSVGSCGTAAWRKAQVITPDIARDPLWSNYADYFIASFGMRACWSTPILDGQGVVRGTFAFYFRDAQEPHGHDQELIEAFTHLAGIAIERSRASEVQARLEEQLRQSQKLEAIGTLAGGVAHDFNNLMSGVLGHITLLRRAPDDPARVLKAIDVIERAARRAAELTTQLLGFARKGRYQSVPVNMNELLEDVRALLSSTVDKNIDLVQRLAEPAPWAQGDPAQMHQVILNLAVNARDSMPDGGVLTFESAVAPWPDGAPGDCVAIRVRDTGHGIPADVQERVFEPFFTTREQGKGSGMGLATAYGIAQSHGGALTFETTPGGTTFTFRLPRAAAAGEPRPEPQSEPLAAPPPGRGRLLVVDDEVAVREVCADMLIELGYDVVTAVDGRQAVDLYTREWRSIDLVLLDMIMPNLGGRDCFREMKKINPAVKAILVTGYARDDAARQILADGVGGFLQKPYEMEQLANLVAGMVGRQAA